MSASLGASVRGRLCASAVPYVRWLVVSSILYCVRMCAGPQIYADRQTDRQTDRATYGSLYSIHCFSFQRALQDITPAVCV